MLNAVIVTSNRIIFEGRAWSVFLPGIEGEFEVMELHKPIISLLGMGKIIVDWEREIPINKGAVRMSDDELVAIVEE